ncbi:O-antigen ligase [Bradyrhizobium sp. LB7.2]
MMIESRRAEPRRSPQMSAQPASSWLDFLAGALDGLIFLSYLFEIDQAIYYSAAIFLKVALLAIRGSGLSRASHSSFPFLYALAIAEVISATVNDVGLISSIRIFVFCVNLAVTLSFVGTSYWRGLVLVSSVDALLYLAMLQTGRISSVFGRYIFFADSHPNLGSEIFFSAAFAALFTKTPRISLLLVALFFAPAFFMQGRAAELGILGVGSVLVWQLSKEMSEGGRLALFALVAVLALTAILTVDLSALLNKVLLLDSEYRGESTNASGRNQYWQTALELWFNNPFFGAGSDYPTRLGTLQAHSFFLYPLAYYGVLGLAPLLIFLKKIGDLAINDQAIYILPLIPMLAFNDRFVNLNTYPTVMFLFVFYQTANIKRRNQKRRLFTRTRTLHENGNQSDSIELSR